MKFRYGLLFTLLLILSNCKESNTIKCQQIKVSKPYSFLKLKYSVSDSEELGIRKWKPLQFSTKEKFEKALKASLQQNYCKLDFPNFEDLVESKLFFEKKEVQIVLYFKKAKKAIKSQEEPILKLISYYLSRLRTDPNLGAFQKALDE